ncbi:MAG: anaerobic glycerol-3-phosphate dehydrogenase subunit C [Planctomycetaceae bacterium]|nr:anaerobic glycerol-3-phosphate dehydrogenase subunit C [Planctomycetaceae bacterium]
MEDIGRQLAEDLDDLLEGELRVDDVTTAIYATDASLYEVRPLAVAFPRNAGDVATLAAYCSDNQIPLIPRGAGTGLAGGCLGSGVVVDFSRHMNRVIRTGPETVRVQPGITLHQLNEYLRPHGRYFAPDPSAALVTTIGGMIGVDAAGSHAFRIGSTRDHVDSLQCVVMGGQILELGQLSAQRLYSIHQPVMGLPEMETESRRFQILPPVRNETLKLTSLTPATRLMDITERLSALLEQAAETIREHQPPLLRNSCGYMLRGVLQKDRLNLPRLLTGSEGTLGLVTEATLHTMPLEQNHGMMVLMFGSMDAALKAMQLLLILEPSACDLMDRRLLSLGRDSDKRFLDVIDRDAEAGLFLEFPGSSRSEVERRLNSAEILLRSTELSYLITRRTSESSEVELLWKLPARVVSLLAGLKGSSRPLPFVEDVAVPPESISSFLTLAQKTFQKHEVTATLYAHAASGQLHLRPMIDLSREKDVARLEEIARELYRHVKSVGGTISGEHGDGFSRTAFIRSQYGPLYRTFQQVKDIFDPQHLLNPDKIISNDGQLTIRHLRKIRPAAAGDNSSASAPLLPIVQLNWSTDQAMEAASRCNGCGTCRTTSDQGRMCPFFHDESAEENSPRSKANLVRRFLSGEDPAETLASEDVRQVVESCFNCKQCQLECPSEVDIPHLVLEARAGYVAAFGLSQTDSLLSRFHTYARFASRFTMMANRILRHTVFRSLLQKTVGIAEQRRLPLFSSRPFLKSPRVLSSHNVTDPTSPTPTVIYFVDYFANHHDPQLAEAFVRILQHNGFRVVIPQQQTVSGMGMVSVGDLSGAREVAEANLSVLSEAARDGYPVICTEPSAALCLTQEYPLLLNNRDADVVAKQTTDAGSFLWKLHIEGRLKLDFSELKISVAYHTPCHVKALGPETGLCNLLELIPNLTVIRLEKGCSGMAGTFGMAAEHFQTSISIGRPLMETLNTIDVQAGTTDCSSCRMQMEQQSDIPTVHPVKLLALAYGLMPELGACLTSRPAGRIMS